MCIETFPKLSELLLERTRRCCCSVLSLRFLVEAGPRTLDICYCIAEWDETTTPLLEAVLIDDQKLVSYLIKSGASTNYARVSGGRFPVEPSKSLIF